jgi:hypothetical protein
MIRPNKHVILTLHLFLISIHWFRIHNIFYTILYDNFARVISDQALPTGYDADVVASLGGLSEDQKTALRNRLCCSQRGPV